MVNAKSQLAPVSLVHRDNVVMLGNVSEILVLTVLADTHESASKVAAAPMFVIGFNVPPPSSV